MVKSLKTILKTLHQSPPASVHFTPQKPVLTIWREGETFQSLDHQIPAAVVWEGGQRSCHLNDLYTEKTTSHRINLHESAELEMHIRNLNKALAYLLKA